MNDFKIPARNVRGTKDWKCFFKSTSSIHYQFTARFFVNVSSHYHYITNILLYFFRENNSILKSHTQITQKGVYKKYNIFLIPIFYIPRYITSTYTISNNYTWYVIHTTCHTFLFQLQLIIWCFIIGKTLQFLTEIIFWAHIGEPVMLKNIIWEKR